MTHQRTLAWHETMELHELIAAQSVGLVKVKKSLRKISDPQLRQLYSTTARALEQNLRELLPFLPKAPAFHREEERADHYFDAGDLLVLAKTSVRNYAIAITETATPALRKVLVKQINAAIRLHEQVFYYMYSRGLYPAYNLAELLKADAMHAQKAIAMR
ncbi:spore coat protein [Bacillus sonorensis]|uniref:Spore coat protein CotF n=2 Tax=Bacillus sonorensis TaxID=119858 RepID=M5P391_9BACI|nr:MULTISPECIES: spore coat protein [Bacillus]TWK83679.1 Spore coat protein F [Bacillus paralicheniformis]ASB91536.1 Spore coat protein [Bacillus sonorensis]EME73899.1 spore coat protein CotF [Bacillus sonorensis L12]MBG9914831.1 spore coat protein [Bacillus sonorensis]MCF7615862.1 spore coat protein [Bacillus sonorensis]